MNPATTSLRLWAATSKHLVRRLLLIATNRLELLLLEVQEGGNSFLRAIGIMIGICVCIFMTVVTLTTLLIVLLWPFSHWGSLLVVSMLYIGVALWLGRKLGKMVSRLQVLPESRDQLRRDREQWRQILK